MSDTNKTAPPSAEPKWWYASLDPDQRPHQLQTDRHEVGFRKKRSAESWIAERLDFDGWRYTLVPLYEAPAGTGEPTADFERECADTDKLLTMLGLNPDECCTDGGSLNLSRIRDRLSAGVVTDEMVSRFLGWKLPEHFNPDCGITFDPISSKGTEWESRREPIGTNLLSADQAREMLEYVLGAGAGEPTEPSARALEFAEYMAKAAEGALDALNALHAVREEKDQYNDGDEGNRAWEAIRADEDAAEAYLSDHLRGLRSGIYEFRKRAAKVGGRAGEQPPETP